MAALAGELVRGDHGATGARAAAAKRDVADAQARPRVFGVGGATANDEAGAKAIHGNRFFADGDETVVEVGE